MSWVQRNNVTLDESRRLVTENKGVVFGSVGVFVVLLLGFPLLLVAASAPVAVALPVGLVFMVAFGIGFRLWSTRKLEEMRADSPPSEGGQHGGERPGG